AAREGARMAVVSTSSYPATSTAQIIDAATSYLAGQPLQNVAVQVYEADPVTGGNIGAWTQAGFGDLIAVQVDVDYPPMIPVTFGVLPNPLHLTAKSIMRNEAN